MKILMVCLGNICRSPLAEGVLKHKIKQNGLPIVVESCGFESFHTGDAPDTRAIEVASAHNIDISNHRARLFKSTFFDEYDKIFVMDDNNYRMVISKARNENDKKKVDYIMNVVTPGANEQVADPYYGGRDNFIQTWKMLDRVTDKIIEQFKQR